MFRFAMLIQVFFAAQVHAQSEKINTSITDMTMPVQKVKRATVSDFFYLPEASHSVVDLKYEETTARFNAFSFDDEQYGVNRIRDKHRDYIFGVNYALTSRWFLKANSAFRETTRSITSSSFERTIQTNGTRELGTGIGFMNKFAAITVVGGMNYAYRPETSFVGSRNIITPHLGFETSTGGGVLGMRGHIDMHNYKANNTWKITDEYSATSSTAIGEAFYEFPVARVAVIGAVAGLRKYLDVAADSAFIGKIYSSVNVIDNTAVTFDLNSASSAQGLSNTSFAVGLRQSL